MRASSPPISRTGSNTRLAGLWVWTAAALYALVWFVLGVWRYRIFRTSFDDGIFTQILSSAFSGFRGTPEWNFNHLASHFSPSLFLVAPLVIAAHSTIVMIALQAIAGALAAPPLYLIARKRLPGWLAALCATVSLVYPPLVGVTFADFHENGFAPAALLWLLWAIDDARAVPAVLLAVFAIGLKEDVAIGLAACGLGAGAWYAARHDGERARLTLTIGVLAVIDLAAYFLVVRPLLHPPFPYQQLRFYDVHALGAQLVNGAKLRYLIAALAPLALLPLLTPAIFLAVPGLVEILASPAPILMSFETQYPAVWAPYLLAAFVGGVIRLDYYSTRLAALGAIVALGISFYVLIALDPNARWYALYHFPNAHDAALTEVLASLPRDAEVSVPDRLYAHLGFDPNAGIDMGRQFVIVDRFENFVSPQWQENEAALEGLVRQGLYRLDRSVDGVEVYERVSTPPRGP
jgi:uncharacterized membrane protein